MPTRRSAAAVANPPMPAPTIATLRGLAIASHSPKSFGALRIARLVVQLSTKSGPDLTERYRITGAVRYKDALTPTRKWLQKKPISRGLREPGQGNKTAN